MTIIIIGCVVLSLTMIGVLSMMYSNSNEIERILDEINRSK